ncbi:MAG: hypothetical protein Q8Q09_23230 [Deltaproteobacteria bacterium]|nr:hypothetical protein [Deltaproteobacteria bacterium]
MKQELESISKAYDEKFAGQSRGTRDMNEMDALLRRVKNVLMQVDATPNATKDKDLVELRASAAETQTMLEAERAAINEAKSAGPDFEQFSPLASQANFVMARYRRHFAGFSRGTRDLGLIEEMAEDLAQISVEMTVLIAKNPAPPFKRDLEAVTQSLAMYRTERDEIARAASAGTNEEQSGNLASVANAQFDIYRDHFAGKGRSSRRVELLERMMRNLERTKTRMEDLTKVDSVTQTNKDNIAVIDGNLEVYRGELEEIRKAKAETKLDDLAGSLGGAANEVFEEYRKRYANKDRRTVDRDRLSVMCDLLGEIEKQMAAIDRGVKNDVNTKNLEIVRSQLAAFESEWDQVTQAQKPSSAR